MKTTSWILIAASVLIIIAVCVGVNWSHHQRQATPLVASSQGVTVNDDGVTWKTYTDSETGYSVSLPDSFVPDSGLTASGLRYFTSTDPKYSNVSIDVGVTGDATKATLLQYYNDLLADKTYDAASTSMNSDGTSFVVRSPDGDIKSFIKNGNEYDLQISFDAKPDPSLLPLFVNIENTFK